MKSPRALRTALTRIRAVSLKGEAVRLVDETWSELPDVVSGEGARRAGGRFNPPGSFAAVYLTEDPRVGLEEIAYPVSAGGRFRLGGAYRATVVPVRFALKRVLNLCDYRVRIALGTDLEEIALPTEDFEIRGEKAPTQILGEAAYRAGWSAIQYSSRHEVRVCNLVAFPERLGPGEYLKPQKPRR